VLRRSRSLGGRGESALQRSDALLSEGAFHFPVPLSGLETGQRCRKIGAQDSDALLQVGSVAFAFLFDEGDTLDGRGKVLPTGADLLLQAEAFRLRSLPRGRRALLSRSDISLKGGGVCKASRSPRSAMTVVRKDSA
jgi:hypothetical protein